MARKERDREDLLAEATALVERIEFEIPGFDEHVIFGFRRDGCASVYFGQDPVYQFNTADRLRRMYRGGRGYKADRGKLVALDRRRERKRVRMLGEEVAAEEAQNLRVEMHTLLERLRKGLNGEFVVIGQVPKDADILTRCQCWLADIDLIGIADSPHAR